MKPLVIYHANCADGFGAAFAAWMKLGDDAEYVPCQYGEQADTWMEQHNAEVTGRDVYILDFSFNRQTMDDFFDLSRHVVLLDHHKTSFETFYGKPPTDGHESRVEDGANYHIELHNGKSGAILAWEYFHPSTEIPMLIRHIDDYDRWQFKIEGTKAFNKALWSYAPWSFEQWKREFLPADMGKLNLTFVQTAAYSALRKEGAAILRAHDQNVQSVVKGAARHTWIREDKPIDLPGSFLDGVVRGWQGLAANCPPHLTSDVGHELATQSGTFGLCWTLGKTGSTANCSLRSNGDYDVSAIAKSFGGGGHRNAAGFEVDIQVLLGWLK